tara:strand:+ start:430 stop:882 length:453 start_codon:yes stop_codon:yes gene_type:complete
VKCTEVLATVFLVQNSRLIAAAAGFDVNTYCHGLGAGICGLNPTDTAFTSGIARIGGYIGHICHSGDMSEVASLPSRAADAGKKTSPWKERIVLLTCIFAAWQIFDDVVIVFETQFGWWANLISFIVLAIMTLFLANQLVLFVEKLQGIR